MQNREPLVRHQFQSYKEVSPIYDHNILFTSLLEKADESQFKISIVSTITHNSDYLLDDDEYEDDNSEGSESEILKVKEQRSLKILIKPPNK